ncbi:cupin domain-containing protein [Sphingomonas crusticola]|uniref:cupin domain-containing protein n=1 Tax=Sphingomonas crusticola TaxID=1697973 RepID=UPI000E24BB8C|nr:cupin domain-containing protein [Sphingomonas crusticola]
MRLFVLGVAGLASVAQAQTPPDPTAFARSAEVRTMIASMAHDIKPDQEMLYRPLLALPPYTVAVEYWVRPKQAAAHLTEAEFVIVLAGSGTLVSGGALADAKHWYGDTNGGRIVGGTSRPLKPGDTFFVPEGTPHWFGIDGGKLVMLTMHVPRPLPAAAR